MKSRWLLSGSTGLIGSALQNALRAKGHEVISLVRSPSSTPQTVGWDFESLLPAKLLSGFTGLIHLAGENIAKKRWSSSYKEKIRHSRIHSTRFLLDSFSQISPAPTVFITASAVGFYGNRGSECLFESSPPGHGFLPDLCKEWEATAQKFHGRSVQLRLGMVLDSHGGALKKLLPLFRWGLGGPLGSGEQFLSWITLNDTISAIEFVLENSQLQGPVNLTSPNPVTNREFSETLCSVLKKRLAPSVPSKMLRFFAGALADELLLSSVRALPKKLQEAGYRFSQPELGPALISLLIASPKT